MNNAISSSERERIIVRTSSLGIATNVTLAIFKAVIGITANSIGIVLDAVNNLTDALSSIITIVGTKLSTMAPTKKHPLGYGRIEYISALIVAGLVLYAGIASAVASVKQIINPQKAEYAMVPLAILAVAIVIKIALGRYVKAQGQKVSSGALIASGSGDIFDAILSTSVLASALIYLASGLALEAYVGIAISLFIIKSGLEMIVDTVNNLLGQRDDPQFVLRIKKLLADEPEVRGAYDLIIYNYGPTKNLASVHLELPDTMTVGEVDILTRRVEAKIYKETGVILSAVGVYSHNTKSDAAAKLQNEVESLVLAHPWAIEVHGFYLDDKIHAIRFDVVLTFDIPRCDALQTLRQELQTAYPDYTFTIIADIDVSASI